MEKTKINKIRNEKGVTTDITETQSLMRDYYKKLCANTMDNLEEINKLLKRYNLTRLKLEERENMKKTMKNTEIESVIKKTHNK